MERKLLAAAFALACAAPTLAQVPAELQIYGRVHVSVEHITVDNSSNTVALPNNSTNELVDNSSRIGFRGNKDIGSGLKGLWQIESRVRLDSGGSTGGETAFLSSRDSYAGLQGGFGTIRAGRTIGPVYYQTYDSISLHNHDVGTSADNLLSGAIFGNSGGFMNNTLWYTSPKLGSAFTIDAAYSFGPDGTSEAREAGLTDQPRYIGLVGAYDQGGLHVAVAYANTQNTSNIGNLVTPQGNDDTVYTLAARYDFTSFVLGGLIERSASTVFGAGDAERTYWRVSAMLPMGKNEFHLNVGNAGEINTDDGAVQWTIAWNHNFTRETKVFVFYTAVDNDDNGTYGFRQATPAVAGADFSSFALGVRHNF